MTQVSGGMRGDACSGYLPGETWHELGCTLAVLVPGFSSLLLAEGGEMTETSHHVTWVEFRKLRNVCINESFEISMGLCVVGGGRYVLYL